MGTPSLCTDVFAVVGEHTKRRTVRTASGKSVTIDIHIEEGHCKEMRYVYVHNSLIVGVGSWRGFPIGSVPEDFAGGMEIVFGRQLSVFWIGGGWVVADGDNIDGSEKAIDCAHIKSLDLPEDLCYAFVVQSAGAHGPLWAETTRVYTEGCWRWTRDGLLVDANPRIAASEVRRFAPDERSAAIEALGRMQSHACAEMVCWTPSGGVRVRNHQLQHLLAYQSGATRLLIQHILSERGFLFVFSRKHARRYHRYIDIVWKVYINYHVTKSMSRIPGVLKDVVSAAHKKYIERIGTCSARTTRKTIREVLDTMSAPFVARNIILWELSR